MQFHQSMIYTHRPWMSKHNIQPQPPRSPGYRHARGMCVHSAVAIAKILNLYESQQSLRHVHHGAVHVAASAALLLLFADVCACEDWRQEEVVLCLSTCFRALGEFAASWESARLALDRLLVVQQKWDGQRAAGPVGQQPQAVTDNADGSQEQGQGFQGQGLLDDAVLPLGDGEGFMDDMLFDPDLDWSLMPEYPLPLCDDDYDRLPT